MPHKGPHISIGSESLVGRILHIHNDEFADWPETVRRLTMEIAEELFLVRYNPFINADAVKQSVYAAFEQIRRGLDVHYANTINEGITMFWSSHDADVEFRKELIERLLTILPKASIDERPASQVENATDATDLRMELPLLVITPASADEISAVVKLANEMQFALIPRGGGSGLTGGAIPARKRSVILSLTRLTKITGLDTEKMTLTAEAGVLTIEAMNAADEHNLLFAVDPASKNASTIGGNIAENSGGPLAVEYGTTIDSLLSFRMVTPTGEIIEVNRKDHPWRKIEEDDEAVFEVRDLSGGLRNEIRIKGTELRKPGLGKDVTDKVLKRLPGLQKEGVDGIITEGTFILYPKLKHYRVVVLEFFGRSMHNATLAINDIVALRKEFGQPSMEDDQVKLSMLEEFNSKYVQAIEYKKKSTTYEGDPISVLIIQLDSNDEARLDTAVNRVVEICRKYEGVDSFVAKDNKEAELYWEDRHKLSAISKRTSGFKINEDIVIPIAALPEFALFLEELNIECMARAYRNALQEVGRLPGMADEDKDFNREFTYASRIIKGDYKKPDPKADTPVEDDAENLSDAELQLHAVLYLGALRKKYPHLAGKISKIEERMLASQVVVASHMHAGDGNCHVNIPVNSGDAGMMAEAERVAEKVMKKANDLGGAITGEHGVGITKIAFQDEELIREIREFKQLVDPLNIINPAKLTQRELPVRPFTFSFNRLIEDLLQSGLPNKERLISLLRKIQICTRCGKCKEVCAMHYPESGFYYYPRNRNISLGAMIEAIYYSQVHEGKPSTTLLFELSNMIEHCTACGKCTSVCPVKIDSAEVVLILRSFLEEEGAGGHPIKHMVMNYLAKNPSVRVPKFAKLASVGQKMQNKFMPLVPGVLRKKIDNPLFSNPGPTTGYKNLYEDLRLDKGSIFVPEGEVKGTVLYFPGCGGSLFYRSIGLAGVMMLIRSGWAVVLPDATMCCGYPLLAAGMQEAFAVNQDHNISRLKKQLEKAAALGLPVSRILTACGSCRDGLERHFLKDVTANANKLAGCDVGEIIQQDVTQFLLQNMSPIVTAGQKRETMVYHSPCHAEWTGVHKSRAGRMYAKAIGDYAGLNLKISTGCCGESGSGAMTSPDIFNRLRERKAADLKRALTDVENDAPVLVGCPSCRIGIARTLIEMGDKRKVMHTMEYMALQLFGKDWRARCRKLGKNSQAHAGKRTIDLNALAGVKLTAQDKEEEED